MGKKFCVIGKSLPHTFSPEIHGMFGLDYGVVELPEVEDLAAFVKNNDYDGFNVTIPYKRDIMSMIAHISEDAIAIGAVNTVVRKDGELYGYNTDVDGIRYALKHAGIDVNNSSAINSYFAMKAILKPVTTDKNLSYFKAIGDIRNRKTELSTSNSYFKFDIYLTVDTYAPISSSTNINANVFFKNIENALSGVICPGSLANGNHFKNMSVPSEYSLLPTLPESGLKINSADATRLAFAIYDPIDIEQQYTTETPSNYIIYQRGTKYPSYSSASGLYSFGGILPEEYNIAAKEIEKLFGIDSDELKSRLTADVLERMESDKLMTQSNYHIWQSPASISGTNYLGIVGDVNGYTRTKMKITVYFWFEGWDADCLNFIDGKTASIGLIFATDTKNNS